MKSRKTPFLFLSPYHRTLYQLPSYLENWRFKFPNNHMPAKKAIEL